MPDTAKKATAKKAVVKKAASAKKTTPRKRAVSKSSAENPHAELSLANQTPANTGYVKQDEVDEDKFDLERDGADDGKRREVKQEFVLEAHLDPMRQRDPNGIYLDDVQRRKAEIHRARVEDREPDFENMGSTAGDVVIPKHVAQSKAREGAEAIPYTELPVVVGDYDRDRNGEAVTSSKKK